MHEQSRRDLAVYLEDHYAGAVGAIELLTHLTEAHKHKPLESFFRDLHAEVTADHKQLHNLMAALGLQESKVRNAGAWIAEKLGRAKLGFSADETGDLRLLQALESLFLGITGKQALWRALAVARETSPVLQQTDFVGLEERASEQASRVEMKRLETARAIFRAV